MKHIKKRFNCTEQRTTNDECTTQDIHSCSRFWNHQRATTTEFSADVSILERVIMLNIIPHSCRQMATAEVFWISCLNRSGDREWGKTSLPRFPHWTRSTTIRALDPFIYSTSSLPFQVETRNDLTAHAYAKKATFYYVHNQNLIYFASRSKIQHREIYCCFHW